MPRPARAKGKSRRAALRLALCAALAGAAPLMGAVQGDFNQDLHVDLEDLDLLRAALGTADPCCDLNADGQVNFDDFFLLADRIEAAPALPDSVPAPSLPDTAGADSLRPGAAIPDSAAAIPAVPEDSVAALSGLDPVLPEAPDSAAVAPAAPPDTLTLFPQDPPPYYTVTSTARTTTVSFLQYTLTIRNSNPFGIVSLRFWSQSADFAHPELPLGDWEWFWFTEPGWPEGLARFKVMEAEFSPPAVEHGGEGVTLRFRRPDVLRRGVELEIAYHLRARRPEFAVEYTIHNHSGRFLTNPYLMVGFPGFANQQWVSSVSTSQAARTPVNPYTSFLEEALALHKNEYLLLRQDLDLRHQTPGELRGSVSLSLAGQRYTVETSFIPTAALDRVYAAHTNKTRYLTSHLYVFLRSMAAGESRTIAVQYTLSRE